MVLSSVKDNTLANYDNNAPEISARYEEIDFSQVQNELFEILSGRTRVLEIGCGSGRDAAFLLSRGIDVTALDGSRAMLAEAKRLHPELDGRLLHHRLPEPLPFSDGEFDAAYSIATLMHLQKNEIPGVVRDILRVLKDGGLFYLSVSLDRDDVGADGLDGKGRLFTVLTEEDWGEMCLSCGFREVRRGTSRDSVGRRGIVWGNFLFEKAGGD